MAEIQWWAYTVVGVGVALTSAMMDISLFLWVGLAFIVVGIAKLAMMFLTHERPSHILHCPHCQVKVLAKDRFCRGCGKRLHAT